MGDIIMEKHTVKVVFANGDYFYTKINGTKEEIENYYVDKYFNMGTVTDSMQKCIRVEF